MLLRRRTRPKDALRGGRIRRSGRRLCRLRQRARREGRPLRDARLETEQVLQGVRRRTIRGEIRPAVGRRNTRYGRRTVDRPAAVRGLFDDDRIDRVGIRIRGRRRVGKGQGIGRGAADGVGRNGRRIELRRHQVAVERETLQRKTIDRRARAAAANDRRFRVARGRRCRPAKVHVVPDLNFQFLRRVGRRRRRHIEPNLRDISLT